MSVTCGLSSHNHPDCWKVQHRVSAKRFPAEEMAPDRRDPSPALAKENSKAARARPSWRKKNNTPQNNAATSIKSVHAVILGKDGVGKTALTVRLLTRRFIGEYDSSLESTYRRRLQLDDTCVSLDLMDTAGENHDSKLQHCALFGDLFILLYSITDPSSYKEAKHIGRFLKRLTSSTEQHSFVVVATKRDLFPHRKVYQDEGKKLARELNGQFYEISSAEGFEETQSMLHDALRQHLQQKINAREREARGLLKMKDELVERTKSLYRKRGMTF